MRLREDGSGEVVGYTLDVSAERAAEARAVAAARLASLGEMAGGLAHELKQPLQAISLAAENASHEIGASGPASVTTRLDRISHQALRAGEIVESLRRFARGSDATQPPADIRLDTVLAATLALMGPALRASAIELKLDAGTPPAWLRGDEIALEQVLTNLLRNARDAIEARPHDARREIRIEAARAAGGFVAIRVADTGGGIPATVMDRLFEPFVTTKDIEHGTGLGLSICHGLVAAMGGTIAAENAGEGAVFTITLPEGTPAAMG
jgi:C4-dicarboxylate-specific signal transduction histidine kinase